MALPYYSTKIGLCLFVMESNIIPNWNNHVSEIPQIILKDVLNQLNRDLIKAGIDEMDKNALMKEWEKEKDSLVTTLSSMLTEIYAEKEEKWWNLIYIVDLPEIVMRGLILEGLEQKMNEIGKLLLIREWQKVELKRRFIQ